MRWLFRILVGLSLLFGLVLLAIGGWALLPARTAPIAGADSIATLERVSLGGQEQTILIRGHDRSKPVLLYVHGGPGFAHLPLAPLYGEALEEHFVVVHWDQRGAGASCPGTDFETLSREQIVADTLELSAQLGRRFGGEDERIFLLGHSWGSIVGALAAQQRPEQFHAYVGLGQLVNGRRNEELSLQFVREEARRRGDEEALAELMTIEVPYATRDALGTQREWLGTYRGSIYAEERAREALPAIVFGREYTLGTRLRFADCFQRTIEALWDGVDGFDVLTQIPRLEVPVFLFTGRRDWNTKPRRHSSAHSSRSSAHSHRTDHALEVRKVAGVGLARTRPVNDEVTDARFGVDAERVLERSQGVEPCAEADAGEDHATDAFRGTPLLAACVLETGNLGSDDAGALRRGEALAAPVAGRGPALAEAGGETDAARSGGGHGEGDARTLHTAWVAPRLVRRVVATAPRRLGLAQQQIGERCELLEAVGPFAR
jgi:pimeloyl-ACP methyl ester carboxylesterase